MEVLISFNGKIIYFYGSWLPASYVSHNHSILSNVSYESHSAAPPSTHWAAENVRSPARKLLEFFMEVGLGESSKEMEVLISWWYTYAIPFPSEKSHISQLQCPREPDRTARTEPTWTVAGPNRETNTKNRTEPNRTRNWTGSPIGSK